MHPRLVESAYRLAYHGVLERLPETRAVPLGQALFRAVVEQEAELVEADIERAAPDDLPPRDALIAGGEAYLKAMALPGRTRLLLIDGPAVLGRAGMDEIDGRHATRSLQAGITFAVRSGDLPKDLPVEATTQLLSSAFDRAALAIEAGGDAAAYASALVKLIDGLAALRRPQE